jgi:hypothetical protein
MPDQAARSLKTRRGDIRLPGFFPVTTFGNKYPLDRLIRPYLPRLCQGMLVSHHYAAHLDENPNDHPGVPLFIDSGGFALLFEGSRVTAQAGVFGIRTQVGDLVTPDLVLQRQMRHEAIRGNGRKRRLGAAKQSPPRSLPLRELAVLGRGLCM